MRRYLWVGFVLALVLKAPVVSAQIYITDVEYVGMDTFDADKLLKITYNYSVSKGCEYQCEEEYETFYWYRVELFDCHGKRISAHFSNIRLATCDPENYTESFETLITAKRFPKTYKLSQLTNQPSYECLADDGCVCGGPEGCIEADLEWEQVGSGQLGSLDSLDCSDFFPSQLRELVCYAPGQNVNTITNDNLKLYKSSREFYQLPADDVSGATHGETANGEFIAPGDGILVVKVSGDDISTNVFGSSYPNGPGWRTLAGREGSLLDSRRCFNMSTGNKFKFNIQTGKANRNGKPFNLYITFWWFYFPDNACCWKLDIKTFSLTVQPLACVYDGGEPVHAKRRYWVKSDGSIETELAIPCCSSCQNKVCIKGNQTGTFVVWPTLDGSVITNGHAKGWKIDDHELHSPGPASSVYEFSD